MILNKKGFTLVELLAVIVILAVVMLIGVTAVGPLMARSRKNALVNDALAAVNSAKAAFQAEQFSSSSGISATTQTCFDIKWLQKNGYYEKTLGTNDAGSVLITYNGGNYTYKVWISNADYSITGPSTSGVDSSGLNEDSVDTLKMTAPSDCKGTGKKFS